MSWEAHFATGNTGYNPVPMGALGQNLWYSQAADFGRLDIPELEHLGGIPWEEYDWEDGQPAPVRPVMRGVASGHERPEETLPDVDALWGAEVERGATKKAAVDPDPIVISRAERERIDYQAAKEAAEEDIRRYRKIKYAMKAKRRAMINAEWEARRAQ